MVAILSKYGNSNCANEIICLKSQFFKTHGINKQRHLKKKKNRFERCRGKEEPSGSVKSDVSLSSGLSLEGLDGKVSLGR